MAAQQRISSERLEQKIEQELSVIIDEVTGENIVGRTNGDAPEIDGVIYLSADTEVKVGDLVTARVRDADEYDLYGEIVA